MLRAELKQLTEHQSDTARQINDIKTALSHCSTCCDDASIFAFLNLREQGLTWDKACNALSLKPSTLRAKTNQRFVNITKKLHEPWARDYLGRERLIALITGNTTAILKFSLLSEEQLKEAITQLALIEKELGSKTA